MNGESAWILICDAQTKILHGDCQKSKASPVKYLKSFLQEYSPTCEDKFVMLDQGGELYQNPEICNLFCKFGYEVRCTGADASKQNGPVEYAHCTISNSIWILLFGSGLPTCF